MKPLKRGSRKDKKKAEEANNRVVPHNSFLPPQFNEQFSSQENMTTSNFMRNKVKVEPISLSSRSFLEAHETSMNIDSIMENEDQEATNKSYKVQPPPIRVIPAENKDKKKGKKSILKSLFTKKASEILTYMSERNERKVAPNALPIK